MVSRDLFAWAGFFVWITIFTFLIMFFIIPKPRNDSCSQPHWVSYVPANGIEYCMHIDDVRYRLIDWHDKTETPWWERRPYKPSIYKPSIIRHENN